MKIKTNDLVKVYFINGISVEGIVIKWSKKNSILTAPSGKKLTIYRTKYNVQMVQLLPQPRSQETAPSEIPVSKPLPQPYEIWKYGSEMFGIEEVRDNKVIVRSLLQHDIMEFFLVEFTKDKWQLTDERYDPAVYQIYDDAAEADTEIEVIETLQQPQEVPLNKEQMRLKNLIQLKKEQKQIETQKIKNQMRTFKPNYNLPKVQYATPFESKPSHNSSEQKINRIA
jgi:sRNA-binding regulator protein Hfq